jgi:hypothetical protein
MTEVVAAVGVFLQHQHLPGSRFRRVSEPLMDRSIPPACQKCGGPSSFIGLLEPRRDARTMFQRPW